MQGLEQHREFEEYDNNPTSNENIKALTVIRLSKFNITICTIPSISRNEEERIIRNVNFNLDGEIN